MAVVAGAGLRTLISASPLSLPSSSNAPSISYATPVELRWNRRGRGHRHVKNVVQAAKSRDGGGQFPCHNFARFPCTTHSNAFRP